VEVLELVGTFEGHSGVYYTVDMLLEVVENMPLEIAEYNSLEVAGNTPLVVQVVVLLQFGWVDWLDCSL